MTDKEATVLTSTLTLTSALTSTLIRFYRRLRAHFGPQNWWPGDSPFEVIVGAVLTQRAAWSNVERAIGNLKTAGALSPSAIARMPEARLAGLIRPSGCYNQKAKKLKSVVKWLLSRCGGDPARLKPVSTAILREELLALNGIGPETADSILLYALRRPVFVVDAYTRRALGRIGIRKDKDKVKDKTESHSYAEIQALFHGNLPRDAVLFNDYHAQWVALGKHFCKSKPLCEGCPLREVCQTGRELNHPLSFP